MEAFNAQVHPIFSLLAALYARLISGLHQLFVDIRGLKGILVLVIQGFSLFAANKVKDVMKIAPT